MLTIVYAKMQIPVLQSVVQKLSEGMSSLRVGGVLTAGDKKKEEKKTE